MIDKINSLIGKPYDKDNFHCYHLVKELVPKAPDWTMVASIVEGLKWSSELTRITEQLEDPEDGVIVLLGRSPTTLYHAGVYFSGLVVHVDKCGTRAEPLFKIKLKYPEMRFYRCM